MPKLADGLGCLVECLCHVLYMARESKYTCDLLAPLVETSFSMAGVLQKLGLKYTGGNYRHIQQRIKAFDLDTGHFTGQAWNRGETVETNTSVAKGAEKGRIPDSEVFREKSTYQAGKLAKRLVEVGRSYVCAECSIDTWKGKPLTLHVDHANGDTSDNRLDNLRFLCPNCHQQTPTWGNRK